MGLKTITRKIFVSDRMYINYGCFHVGSGRKLASGRKWMISKTTRRGWRLYRRQFGPWSVGVDLISSLIMKSSSQFFTVSPWSIIVGRDRLIRSCDLDITVVNSSSAPAAVSEVVCKSDKDFIGRDSRFSSVYHTGLVKRLSIALRMEIRKVNAPPLYRLVPLIRVIPPS